MAKKSTEKWEKLNDRQIVRSIVVDGIDNIFIIAPRNYKKMYVPLFCPLCELAMKTKEDITEYKREHMCERCSYKWANKKDIIYKKNFKDSDEWQEYLEYREQISKVVLNLK